MQWHIKYFRRRSCPKQDKKQQSIGTLVENIYTQIHLTVLNIKNCISKLSIKMFMKRKARKPGNDYAYRMLLSFKINLEKTNFTLNSCVRFEAFFVGHGSNFLSDIVRCLIFTLVIYGSYHSAALYYMIHSSYRIVQSSYYITHWYYTGIMFQRHVYKNLLGA